MSLKISICIPTYNQSKYIEQAVRSAATQTLAPLEIVVSDDCSTDNTIAILERLQSEVQNLKVYKQHKNLGIAKNTDFCLRLAEGEYIVRLDSDDFLSDEFCKILSQQLAESPDAGYAHAAVQEVDENGNPRKIRRLYRNTGFEAAIHSLQASVKGYRVAANIIMFRKSALTKVNYLAGRPEYVEDYHLSVSLAAAGYGNVYINSILANYRVWTDAGKVRQKRKLAEIVGIRRVFEDMLEPAFAEKSQQNVKLLKSRELFACNHAVCLSWDVYNKTEKDELERELYNLSHSPKAKLYRNMYRKGFGKPIEVINRLVNISKASLKKVFK